MDSVERFIRELKSDSVATRRYAAEMLGRLGDPRAIDALIDALENDNDPSVQGDAIDALAKFADERAVNAIIRALGSEYPWVGTRAVYALSKYRSPSAVDAIAEALLHNEAEGVRIVAAETLGEIGDPRAVDALSHAVQHDDSFPVRVAAAESLGTIGDPRAVDALVSVYKTLHWGLRSAAAASLAQIGDPRGLDAFLQSFSSPDYFERETALRLVGKFPADVRMLAPIAKALHGRYRDTVYESVAPVIRSIIIAHPDSVLALPADDGRAVEHAVWTVEHERIRKMLCSDAGGGA